jgi:hypothetical protein
MEQMMIRANYAATVFAACAGLAVSAGQAAAHGFAGDRFFPATILTDDPFVADEMSAPTLIQNPNSSSGSKESDVEFDLAKRLTPDFGVTFDEQWQYTTLPGAKAMKGLGGLTTGQQYQLFVDPGSETMALAGFQQNWAHTGRVQGAGAPDFTTLSPVLDFGKGFGDLPDAVPYLKPFAITGNMSFDFPLKTQSSGAQHPNNFNLGFAFEYSLEYLQHHVKDVGLSAPFDRVIPLVEIAFSDPVNRGMSGQLTGTIQPGAIWAGQYYQIAAEAILPLNSRSGHGYGGLVQLHFFLDDLFPNSIGRPLLGM